MLLTTEIERLRLILSEKGKESDELRHKSHKMDDLQQYVETLKSEVQKLSYMNKSLLQDIDRLKFGSE